MIYVDTNVIISFVDGLDSNHEKALKLLVSLKDGKVVSKLTLIELASVSFRAGLEDPLALAMYSIRRSSLELADIDFNVVLGNAFKMASILTLEPLTFFT
ncbi:MAG: PIN domain-containing protein [Nitrososphaeria archaeon]